MEEDRHRNDARIVSHICGHYIGLRWPGRDQGSSAEVLELAISFSRISERILCRHQRRPSCHRVQMPIPSKTQALIVGNGEPPSRTLFDRLMQTVQLLVCADGGANIAAGYGYTPDYIIGDLDSLEEDARSGVAAERIIKIDADNTSTDLHKVLVQVEKLGVTRAVMVGVTGGRTDHVLWNLSLLKTFAGRLQLRIVDDYCDTRLVGAHIRFRAPVGQKLSLCPLSGPVSGIETAGLKFALRRETLSPGIREGISNEVVENPVEIRVGRGDLLLCIQREEGLGDLTLLET